MRTFIPAKPFSLPCSSRRGFRRAKAGKLPVRLEHLQKRFNFDGHCNRSAGDSKQSVACSKQSANLR